MSARAWLLAASLAAGGCSRSDAGADLQPPPGFQPPPIRPLRRGELRANRLGFGLGFFPLEVGGDGTTWRWMNAHGEIRLENDGRPRVLRLDGWLPLEFLDHPPTVRVAIEGRQLDSFVAADRTLDQKYTVGPELLGTAKTVLLTLDTSSTAHAPGDSRELGIALRQVDWVISDRHPGKSSQPAR